MKGKTLYIGDTHSDFETMETLARFVLHKMPDIQRVVQVGDFGFWPDFSISYWYQQSTLPVPVYFIDGNHEQFPELGLDSSPIPAKKSPIYDAFHIPRGYCESGVFYMGGADSPDKEYRKEGIDWFSEENLRRKDIENAYANLSANEGPVHVMVCHETTEGAFPLIRRPHWAVGDDNRLALEKFFKQIKPRLFIYGHYHFYRRYEHEGCTFIALRNPDHFHYEVTEGSTHLLSIVQECCLVADEQGRIFAI